VACAAGPDISESGLVFCYDFGNREKAFGTTNLIPNIGLNIYNNVPAHVTASLTQTSETYRGSPVWTLTLTPTTATGVSYLTAGGNPGLGVLTGGGGGTGGVYTGHSIFYKPTVPMHSSPIFTNYSNIAGWQSGTNYDDMGDGWYRAHVVWYDIVTRSDGKYWAINPASATLNVPITIYWAAPFKEAQNYTNFVSPYTLSTRGSGSGVVNLTNQEFSGGVFVNGPTYSSANGGSLVFDGVDDRVSTNYKPSGARSYFIWVKFSSLTHPSGYQLTGTQEVNAYTYIGIENGGSVYYYAGASTGGNIGNPVTVNTWVSLGFVLNADGSRIVYKNGVNIHSNTGGLGGTATLEFSVGCINNNHHVNGNISNVSVYNRALTAQEVQQNYNATRGRYGI
jgi:hypothetical protein